MNIIGKFGQGHDGFNERIVELGREILAGEASMNESVDLISALRKKLGTGGLEEVGLSVEVQKAKTHFLSYSKN